MPDREPAVLAGVRVLDASQLLPGPWAAQLLGDLGASVVKVEPPQGDAGRTIRGELFAPANSNKSSVVVDLKSPAGRAEFLGLAAEVDILIEGYRPGVMERLGVGYQDVRRVNPRIIYCSVSGYGRDRPDSQLPGHDINYLAASGALSFSGHWGQPPRRPGIPMADLASASAAVIAILGALYDRDVGGRSGCQLDVSMTDTMTWWAAARGGPRQERSVDDRRHLYPTNDLFRTRDGRWIALGAVEDKFWDAARAVLAVAEPRLAEDRYRGLDARMRLGDEVHELVGSAFARHDLDTWLRLFAGTDAPVSPVLSLTEVADDPVNVARGVVQRLGGERRVVFPVRRDGAVMGRLRRSSPPSPGGAADDSTAASETGKAR